MMTGLGARSAGHALVGACLFLTIALPARSETEAPVLSERVMAQAIGYFGVMTGREISAEDGAWLKQQWAAELASSPDAVAASLDQLALGLERHERGQDPLALASGRNALIKQTHCAAEQTSDPDVHRLKAILAPDDLVLAADCALGLVVTPFDVDGLAASHALTASIGGQSHDTAADKAELTSGIIEGFSTFEPAQKEVLANGELRHAVAARFWSRIDGQQTQVELAQTLAEQARRDLGGAARNLERLALQKLGEVDYIARAGEAKLTGAMMAEYLQWLELIAGYSLSARDRAWIEDVIVDEFLSDPNKMLQEVASIDVMNRDYAIADHGAEKASLLATWTANLHCYLDTSGNPDEIRLADIVFLQDPVVSADCPGGSVTRKRDAVLAEAGGQTLTERRLERSSLRFMSFLLGRPLTPEEASFIRDDSVQEFKNDPSKWQSDEADVEAILAKADRNRNESFFLGIDERKKLFDPIYCTVKEEDDPAAPTYLAMFQRDNAIVHENCSANLVTTREEIDAFINALDFLAFLAGKPIFTEDERAELAEGLAKEDLSNSESALAGLTEWWSLLSLEKKSKMLTELRSSGITHASDAGNVLGRFVEHAKGMTVLINANRNTCRLSAIISQGNAAIFAAKAPTMSNYDMGIELSVSIPSNNMAATLCGQS